MTLPGPRTEFTAVCNACLCHRPDVGEGPIVNAVASPKRTTHYCSDDFAFAAPPAANTGVACPHCGSSGFIVAVSAGTLASIEKYKKDR